MEIFTTAPPPAAAISRETSWVVNQVPFKFTSTTKSHSSSVSSSRDVIVTSPAQLTSPVIFPNSFKPVSAACLISFRFRTSTFWKTASPPLESIFLQVSTPLDSSISAIINDSPFEESSKQTAFPIPEAPPVTKVTFFPSDTFTPKCSSILKVL